MDYECMKGFFCLNMNWVYEAIAKKTICFYDKLISIQPNNIINGCLNVVMTGKIIPTVIDIWVFNLIESVRY